MPPSSILAGSKLFRHNDILILEFSMSLMITTVNSDIFPNRVRIRLGLCLKTTFPIIGPLMTYGYQNQNH